MNIPKLKRNKRRKPQVLDDLFTKSQGLAPSNDSLKKSTEDKNLKERKEVYKN